MGQSVVQGLARYQNYQLILTTKSPGYNLYVGRACLPLAFAASSIACPTPPVWWCGRAMPTWDGGSLYFMPSSVLSKNGLCKGEWIPPLVKKLSTACSAWEGSKVAMARCSSANKRHCNWRQWKYTFLRWRLEIKDSCSTGEEHDEPEAVVWSEDLVFSAKVFEKIPFVILISLVESTWFSKKCHFHHNQAHLTGIQTS